MLFVFLLLKAMPCGHHPSMLPTTISRKGGQQPGKKGHCHMTGMTSLAADLQGFWDRLLISWASAHSLLDKHPLDSGPENIMNPGGEAHPHLGRKGVRLVNNSSFLP